jgi:hypothetical protein
VVPSATVVIRNVATAAEYRSLTTQTGSYTGASLPVGVYQLSVAAAGFKSFRQDGITVQIAQTARVDVVLQVGAATESITVNADAPLLQTETSEQSTTVARDPLVALPLYFGSGQGGGAIRNPLVFSVLVPGAWYQSQGSSIEMIRVNGMPMQTFKIILEGQDATNSLTQQNANTTMPNLEAVQEFTLQSSNFSAEFGQVTGGMFNFTTRSGTNQYHGGAFEYFTNEDLNAGVPFTSSGNGHLLRPRIRKSDYGVSVGGPVRIPKLYNGKDKTFFFFSYEYYDDQKMSAPAYTTIPTAAMRAGDFSGILDGRGLGTDSQGRSIPENTIYDPGTRQTVNGQIGHQSVSRQHHSGKPHRPGGREDSGIVSAAQQFGESQQLVTNLPQPEDAVYSQYQDRSESERQDEGVALLRPSGYGSAQWTGRFADSDLNHSPPTGALQYVSAKRRPGDHTHAAGARRDRRAAFL